MPATDGVGCGVPPGAVAKRLGVESRTTATAGVGGSTPSAPTQKRLGFSESFLHIPSPKTHIHTLMAVRRRSRAVIITERGQPTFILINP